MSYSFRYLAAISIGFSGIALAQAPNPVASPFSLQNLNALPRPAVPTDPLDPVTGGAHTYHTTNPVPFILVSDDKQVRLKDGGALRDIAPTMLSALGQPRPAEMTGADLRTTPHR